MYIIKIILKKKYIKIKTNAALQIKKKNWKN
jgi:hypothetical protein